MQGGAHAVLLEEVGHTLIDDQDRSFKHHLHSIHVDYTARAMGPLRLEVDVKHRSNPLIQEARVVNTESGRVASKAVMQWIQDA